MPTYWAAPSACRMSGSATGGMPLRRGLSKIAGTRPRLDQAVVFQQAAGLQRRGQADMVGADQGADRGHALVRRKHAVLDGAPVVIGQAEIERLRFHAPIMLPVCGWRLGTDAAKVHHNSKEIELLHRYRKPGCVAVAHSRAGVACQHRQEMIMNPNSPPGPHDAPGSGQRRLADIPAAGRRQHRLPERQPAHRCAAPGRKRRAVPAAAPECERGAGRGHGGVLRITAIGAAQLVCLNPPGWMARLGHCCGVGWRC